MHIVLSIYWDLFEETVVWVSTKNIFGIIMGTNAKPILAKIYLAMHAGKWSTQTMHSQPKI